MTSPSHQAENIWLAAGVRTPFAKIDGPLGGLDAIAMSVPVVKHMVGLLAGGKPDFAVWGNVVPNLTWSNIAREILMDAGIDPTVLARWCTEVGWEVLLNRGGTTFRKLPDAQKTGLNDRKAISLMLAQPSMIKRPVLEMGKRLLVGFQPATYDKVVGKLAE